MAYENTDCVYSCRKSKFLVIIPGAKQYISHRRLIYNLIQELGASEADTERLPFQGGNPHNAPANQCHHHRIDTRPRIKMMLLLGPPAKKHALLPFFFFTQHSTERNMTHKISA